MIKITLPVYYSTPKKTILVGLNWYRNACYFEQNKVKQLYHELIVTQLANSSVKLKTYQITYVYHYKSKISDLANVCAMMSKFLNDALQSLNIVINDNVQFLLEETYCAGTHDPINPRIEATILLKEPINDDS